MDGPFEKYAGRKAFDDPVMVVAGLLFLSIGVAGIVFKAFGGMDDFDSLYFRCIGCIAAVSGTALLLRSNATHVPKERMFAPAVISVSGLLIAVTPYAAVITYGLCVVSLAVIGLRMLFDMEIPIIVDLGNRNADKIGGTAAIMSAVALAVLSAWVSISVFFVYLFCAVFVIVGICILLAHWK